MGCDIIIIDMHAGFSRKIMFFLPESVNLRHENIYACAECDLLLMLLLMLN